MAVWVYPLLGERVCEHGWGRIKGEPVIVIVIISAISMALVLAAEEPRILEDQNEVIRELKPAQLAELWVYAGGEQYGWPKEIGAGDIAFTLSHYQVNVDVIGRDCSKNEPLDFADCQRFSLDAHELHREIDLRSGISVGEISDLLSVFMTQVEEAYPEGPDF